MANNANNQSSNASTSGLRDVFRRKLRHAVDKVGSVKEASAILGVNRTQFNRYLTGESMPRPELLYQFSRKLSLPMEWFFDSSDDFEVSLAEHQFGQQLRLMVTDNWFRVSDEMLPNGFYLVWKGMFDAAWPYEAVLGLVKTTNGVKTLRINMIRRFRVEGRLDDFEHDRLFVDLVIMRSVNGIYLMSMEGAQNHVRSFFLRPRAPGGLGFSAISFSGVGLSGAFGDRFRSSLVPVAMERINPTTKSVLAAARKVGGLAEDKLPDHIKSMLEEAEVPDFKLK